jgi:toxin-antitoxin system PIN domain toxin
VSATVDTNVLLYAMNTRAPSSAEAYELLERLARGPELLYVFWPVVMGFLRLSTNRSLSDDPLSPAQALSAVDSLVDRPHVRAPGEAPGFLDFYRRASLPGARGRHVTDAHIAALMSQHGVRKIYTRDRDFRRFDGIVAEDPFGS